MFLTCIHLWRVRQHALLLYFPTPCFNFVKDFWQGRCSFRSIRLCVKNFLLVKKVGFLLSTSHHERTDVVRLQTAVAILQKFRLDLKWSCPKSHSVCLSPGCTTFSLLRAALRYFYESRPPVSLRCFYFFCCLFCFHTFVWRSFY